MSKLVTVGVPVYNGERFLVEALDGLLAQTHSDLIVQISDNASTDATQEICQDYASRDRRIHYVRHETNQGSAWNFNHLVEAARTPLFMWHAADDLARPSLIATCVAALDKAPEAALAYSLSDSIDESGDAVPSKGRPFDAASPRIATRFQACLDPIPYAENVMYGLMRAGVLKRTQLHGMFAGGDRALCAELALYGPFIRIDETLFHRRVAREIKSVEELQTYNSGGGRNLALREWRILQQNMRSIRRAPLPGRIRSELYAVVLRRLLERRSTYLHELAFAIRSHVKRNR